MLVQVIQRTVTDADTMRAALDRWTPGRATGWLGTTAGVTEDGRSIALTRFESAAAARSEDPWWRELSGGPVTVYDCREATEPPAGVASELDSLVREVTYFDLRQPWPFSPRTGG